LGGRRSFHEQADIRTSALAFPSLDKGAGRRMLSSRLDSIRCQGVKGEPVSAESGRPARFAPASATGSENETRRAATEQKMRDVARALAEIRHPVAIVSAPDGPAPVLLGGDGSWPPALNRQGVLAVLPPIYPEWLGDRAFLAAHAVRFPYVVGEMARGIATPTMVIAGVRAGVMAFYGSAGLRLDEIERGLSEIQSALGTSAAGWGANLIHSPQEPGLELATVELFHRLGVQTVSASAFMRLQPAITWFAAKGLRRAHDGGVVRTGRVVAKVSRTEVARQFLSPPPTAMLRQLVSAGRLTEDEAQLAAEGPVAEDITAEADSGGHTDNRPLTVLLPALIDLRDELTRHHGYRISPRIGAAGGIGTPAAAAAAFAAGAAYIVTGSVNQSAMESGLSADARALLAQADSTDVAMAPAADMFELGVKVQVLKRGTLFAQRGHKLSEFYRNHQSIDEASSADVGDIERTVLGRTVADVWADTRAHFQHTDPAQLERAERDGKHKMALIFRWYLFMGAQWARDGVEERRSDYQIWCGPAMGAFNAWAKGSFLAPIKSRSVAQIALNLLEGAATVTRAGQLRAVGVALPPSAFDFRPRPLG
jgi:trans-AT polyketide synthase, acyltransferase and oxidoreductase domains